MPIINLFYEKVWFTINGPSKMLFSKFFQITIVKNFIEKPFFFIMDFGSSYEVLLHVFDLQIFDYKIKSFLKMFEVCTEMYFVFLFF